MEEDFQESEVIFPESVVNEENGKVGSGFSDHLNSRVPRNNNKPKRRRKKKNSVPVNIPEKVSGDRLFQSVDSDFFDDDGELVPPHVIVGRRVFARKMAFSVCTGNGRTLKGRDLSEVRNSILRMTGFLEA